jgi:hypothetical protein
MANSIKTTGMTQGTITTTHNSGESVSAWVDRHTHTVDQDSPGDNLTTTWPCTDGNESVSTDRLAGESNKDFILRHETEYLLEMDECPPLP